LYKNLYFFNCSGTQLFNNLFIFSRSCMIQLVMTGAGRRWMESMEVRSSLQWTCQPLQMIGTSQVSLLAELQASPQSTHQLQQVFNIANSCDIFHLYILVYSLFVSNKSLMLDQAKGFLKCMTKWPTRTKLNVSFIPLETTLTTYILLSCIWC